MVLEKDLVNKSALAGIAEPFVLMKVPFVFTSLGVAVVHTTDRMLGKYVGTGRLGYERTG